MRLGPPSTLILLLCAALALGACGSSSSSSSSSSEDVSTFEQDGYPFTFDYPSDFEVTNDVSFDSELGSGTADSTAIGLDESNAILLQRATLNLAVDSDNINQAKAEFDGLLNQVDPGASGETGETAGYPSLSYDAVSVPKPEGGESRITVLFDGDQEYVVNCQSTPDQRDAIDAACDQAFATLAPA